MDRHELDRMFDGLAPDPRRERELLGQLLQEQRGLAPAALAGVFGPPPVDGQVPGQPGQEKAQPPGALGRDAVPGSQPGVADALLGVPGVPQDVVGHREAVAAVGCRRLPDGGLVPVPVGFNDLLVSHPFFLQSFVPWF